MEILLDTANIETIKKYNDIYDVTGVTSNPTIISREKGDFFAILCGIRKIIGDKKQLHVQVTADNCEEMLKEAETIVKRLGKDTYIKVPTNEVGIKTMKTLKSKGYNVTATAIYTVQQAVMAASVGADYAAPYFNRMCNNNFDAPEAIAEMAEIYTMYGKKTKLLAASFKNTNQIMQALLAGAEAVTASPELYTQMVESPLIDDAISRFANDWNGLYGDKKIYEL
ncbi:MAG: fructose-6-phosphate aldolase [Clostridia bacterium]|nr:fructose-6-phosphate aldolase [Clostridia bacterium]